MNHSTVAHRWANDSYTSKGELNGPRMFAEQSTRTIYSHGRHFAIARFTGNAAFPLLFTYRGYSSSTSKHVCEVRNALSQTRWQSRFECHNPADSESTILHTEWSALLADNLPALRDAVAKHAAMVARIAARVAKGLPESATLASQLETLSGDVASKQTYIRDRATQLDAFRKAFAVTLGAATAPIARRFLKSDDLMKLSADIDKQAAKYARARAKESKARAEKAIADNLERRAQWLAGENVRWQSSHLEATVLRVKGDNVETSQGASVPVRHALRLYKLASDCVTTGKGWSSPPEKRFSVGHFTLESIDTNGNVVIGCHRLDFAEMARVAPAARLAAENQPVTVD